MTRLLMRTLIPAVIASSACGVSEPIEDRLVGIVDQEDGVPVVSVPEQVGTAEESPNGSSKCHTS